MASNILQHGYITEHSAIGEFVKAEKVDADCYDWSIMFTKYATSETWSNQAQLASQCYVKIKTFGKNEGLCMPVFVISFHEVILILSASKQY